jgi:hypothetical protein
MKIQKIFIYEFGGLKDLLIMPEDGITLVRGGNESGKSTVMSFISFIFYGLPAKKGEGITERSRALSWTGGRASGIMEIESNGGRYRIYRNSILSGAQSSLTETCQITDLDLGTEVFRGMSPSEVFLGVPQQVFESASAVRQLSAGRIAGGDIGSSLENILLSADETVNTSRALKKINAARLSLMPLRGGGNDGKIARLTREREQLAGRLKEAESNSAGILSLRATVDKYRKVTSDLRYKLDSAKNACSAYESYQTLTRFELLHAAEERLASIEADEKALTEEKGKDGRLPDREYVERLDALGRKLALSESGLAAVRAKAAETAAAPAGDTARAEAADSIAAAGGADAVTGEYGRQMSAAGKRLALGIVLAVIGAAVAAGSLLLYFLKPGKPFPALGGPLSWSLTVAGIAAVIAGVMLMISASGKKKKAAVALARFGYAVTPNRRENVDGFAAYAAECEAEKALRDEHSRALGLVSAELEAARSENEELRRECESALAAFGFGERQEETPAGQGPDPSEMTGQDNTATEAENAGRDPGELLAESATAAAETVSKHEKILAEKERFTDAVRTAAGSLAGFSESEIRSRLSAEMIAFLRDANPAQLRFERDSVAAQLESASRKLAEDEKNLAIAEHIYENPAKLALELDAADETLDLAKRKRDALLLASESIENAEKALKKSITPRLRKRCGEILSLLSGGRYTEIGFGENFAVEVSTDSGTKPVQYLSGGTKDICYLSFRLALAELLFRGSPPPLLLDESASQLDDDRAAGLLSMMGKLAENGVQSIFFTCHSREQTLLDALGIPYSLTEL